MPRSPARPASGAPRAVRADADAAAKNRPLMEDIRLLGRILGDVIREQEGKEAFELIERVRQLSVAYRLKRDAIRRPRAGPPAEEPDRRPDGVSVIRAFSYFSHLANIAEDRHHVRRRECTSARATCRRARWRWPSSACRRDIRAAEIARDAAAGLHLAGAHRPPHRGAAQEHPGRRARHRRADRRARRLATERGRADNEALLRARVTQLWQTRMLRYTKLTVADEIENALSYYQATFLRQIPRLYRDRARAAGHEVPSFLRMGHWIGGDRDGNPNVAPTRWSWRCAPGRGGAALLPDRGACAGRRAVDLADCWRR
jgi:phosphoenolpyruvate carboxylase